jgi:NAD(P)H dehydrogenase (quinone)
MIIVSGASGAFGRQAAELLMETVDPGQLILTSRTPAKLIDLAERGAKVRFADFDDPASLEAAFAGGTRMLLISTARVGSRVGQHINAMTAAVNVGVKHIVYTSLLGVAADGNPAIVKLDHLATEQALEKSGAAWTFLRDSQYAEAIAGAMAPGAVATGRLPDNTTGGQIAFVSRDDCVAVATAVLRQEGHENQAYDLTGPEFWTIESAMGLVSELAGKPIAVEPVDDEGMFRHFDALGIPRHASDEIIPGAIPWCSEDMVTFGKSIREGYFDSLTDHVERITGTPPKGLREVMMAYKDSWPQ